MNIPRYLYGENIKNDLLQFLQEANKAKSDIYCNFEQYEQIKNLLPLPNEIKQDLKTFMENADICIDITQSDDETEQKNETTLEKDNGQVLDESNSFQSTNQTNINDIIDSIKDSLSIQNEVSNSIIKDLSSLSNDNLNKLFTSLGQLSLEDVENFWNSLIAKQEFTYEFQTVFLSLSQKYSTVIKNELVKELLTIDPREKDTNRVLQQYVGMVDNNFKTDILRQFISTCEKLHPNYISIIEVLLNPQNEYDLLSKLIELMSNAVTEFSNDNSYGKLLFNVVNLLEGNGSRLEQPLKHILGIHRSIWKIKVQKVVTWFDDSLTQSSV